MKNKILKLSEKTLKVLWKIATREVDKQKLSWPPLCAGIYHQPKRPKKK